MGFAARQLNESSFEAYVRSHHQGKSRNISKTNRKLQTEMHDPSGRRLKGLVATANPAFCERTATASDMPLQGTKAVQHAQSCNVTAKTQATTCIPVYTKTSLTQGGIL
jgi:hypothetical protein